MAKSSHTMKFPESFDNRGDNEKHLFKFRLNRIPVAFARSVAKHDYDRLRACMSQRTSSPSGRWDNGKLFILFDSIGYRCALNTSCVSLAQFLFNASCTIPTDEHFSDEKIRVVPVDGSPIMTFRANIQPVNHDEGSEDVNELQRVFYDLDFLERYIDDLYSIRTVYFTDAGGEIIYLNADDIALLEVPLNYVENT